MYVPKNLWAVILFALICSVPTVARAVQTTTFPSDNDKCPLVVTQHGASEYTTAKASVVRAIDQISEILLNPSRTYRSTGLTEKQIRLISNANSAIRRNSAVIVELGNKAGNETAITLGNGLVRSALNLDKRFRKTNFMNASTREAEILLRGLCGKFALLEPIVKR